MVQQPAYFGIKGMSTLGNIFWSCIHVKVFTASIHTNVACVVALETMDKSRRHLATHVGIFAIGFLCVTISIYNEHI